MFDAQKIGNAAHVRPMWQAVRRWFCPVFEEIEETHIKKISGFLDLYNRLFIGAHKKPIAQLVACVLLESIQNAMKATAAIQS